MGVLYLFRAICMISTVFPRANDLYYCAPQLKNYSDPTQPPVPTGVFITEVIKRVLRMSLGMGLSINGMHTYCGDYLYSGHTVTLTIAYLILREYLLPSRCRTLLWKLLNVLIFVASISGVIAIIVSRGHYLIDILLAYYVTTRVFWIYHTLAYNHELMFASPTNYLSRVWWYTLFQYFECAPHDRKRAFENGQPRPQRVLNCDTPVYGIPRSFEWPLPWPRSLRRRTLLPSQQSTG
ncbi:phosphatidylcholine:ceramide cholinephosphotransferase 1-like protein [Leptotrombidium deliense]|uniref:Phosphatidylcholine:ceramide cholinephosphotransferase 1-like protein n=1 Tax=Leptotrombidium deliense TaxID=299467 RepID=A0A443SJJ3_9ACAR|nr:phosphatidylcholine:ceramide cholinephosphotransferase 1-like protein [Leptotrombidium deliense]